MNRFLIIPAFILAVAFPALALASSETAAQAADPCAAYTSPRGKMMCEMQQEKIARMKAAKQTHDSYLKLQGQRLAEQKQAEEEAEQEAAEAALQEAQSATTEPEEVEEVIETQAHDGETVGTAPETPAGGKTVQHKSADQYYSE